MNTDYVRAARLRTSKLFPYLQSAIWSMTLVKTDQIETMAVDSGWRCYYNEAAMRRRPIEEVSSILVHEVWHLLRKHHQRAARLGINQENALAWNIATDCEINDDLVAQGGTVSDCLLPSQFGWPPDQLAETYYAKIPVRTVSAKLAGVGAGEDTGSGKGQAAGQQGGSPAPTGDGAGDADPFVKKGRAAQWFGGSCADNIPRSYELPRALREAPARGETEAELIRRQVAREITATNKARGTLPAGMTRWADDVLAPPKVDWRKELLVNVRRAIAQIMGQTDYTYRRFGRRSTDQMLRPAMITFRPHVAVVIDTSGSMSDQELSDALSETHHVIRTLNAPVSVISCDAKAHVTKKVFDPRSIQLIGGGGTDMREALKAAVALKPRPDVIITITDGFTPWPDRAPAAEHITLLTNNGGHKPKFGKSISIS
jgi:predicted metal-dependent peptidase